MNGEIRGLQGSREVAVNESSHAFIGPMSVAEDVQRTVPDDFPIDDNNFFVYARPTVYDAADVVQGVRCLLSESRCHGPVKMRRAGHAPCFDAVHRLESQKIAEFGDTGRRNEAGEDDHRLPSVGDIRLDCGVECRLGEQS